MVYSLFPVSVRSNLPSLLYSLFPSSMMYPGLFSPVSAFMSCKSRCVFGSGFGSGPGSGPTGWSEQLKKKSEPIAAVLVSLRNSFLVISPFLSLSSRPFMH